jgi:hypothetical protein
VAKTKKVLNPEGCPAQVAANLTLTEKCLLQAFTGVIMIELPGKKSWRVSLTSFGETGKLEKLL